MLHVICQPNFIIYATLLSPKSRFSDPFCVGLDQCRSLMRRITVVQIDVVRTFGDGEGPPWKHSLFGNPGDADTVKYNHFPTIYYLAF